MYVQYMYDLDFKRFHSQCNVDRIISYSYQLMHPSSVQYDHTQKKILFCFCSRTEDRDPGSETFQSILSFSEPLSSRAGISPSICHLSCRRHRRLKIVIVLRHRMVWAPPSPSLPPPFTLLQTVVARLNSRQVMIRSGALSVYIRLYSIVYHTNTDTASICWPTKPIIRLRCLISGCKSVVAKDISPIPPYTIGCPRCALWKVELHTVN